MGHISGRDGDDELHEADGTTHRERVPPDGGQQGKWEKRLTDHLAFHTAEIRRWFLALSTERKHSLGLPLVFKGAVPDAIAESFLDHHGEGRGRYYVWLFEHERHAMLLPERITTADLWPSIAAAVTDGTKDRPEEARFLVWSVDGRIVNKNALQS